MRGENSSVAEKGVRDGWAMSWSLYRFYKMGGGCKSIFTPTILKGGHKGFEVVLTRDTLNFSHAGRGEGGRGQHKKGRTLD